MLKRTLFILVSLVIAQCGGGASSAWANNLRITSVSLEDRDATANTAVVEFDIAWDNSWRTATNHDAVWLVFKETNSGGGYLHLDLQTAGLNPTGYSTGTNGDMEIYVPTDKTGAFIRRKGSGTGNVSSQNVRMKVSYTSASGVGDSTSIAVRVIGTEMVFIPQGAFYMGGLPATGEGALSDTGASNAWYIDDNGLIATTSSTNLKYYYTKPSTTSPSAYTTASEFYIPAAFPKGYSAFYCMKYEVTEGQYVEFLNGLTGLAKRDRDITTQASAGKNTDGVTFRNTVSGPNSNTFTTLRPDRAMGYLSYMDLAAYLDWMALRPMTEMEFEKAAAGPEAFNFNAIRYAWGSAVLPIAALAFSLSSEETATETFTTTWANSTFGTKTFTAGDTTISTGHARGPARVGIFATSSSSSMAGTGAGYYGVMELSGNLWERTVTFGATVGSAHNFSGTHGDGEITSTGLADASAFPTTNTAVTTADGVGFRGGSWNTSTDQLRIADRTKAVQFDASRANEYGGRGVRTYDGSDL